MPIISSNMSSHTNKNSQEFLRKETLQTRSRSDTSNLKRISAPTGSLRVNPAQIHAYGIGGIIE